MFDHDAFVEHGDDDRLVARRGFPRLFALHVGIDDRLVAEQVASVDQVPLHRQQLVVEGIARIPGGTGRTLHGGEGLADLGLGLIAQFVGPVARIQMVVGFSHGFKHRGMGGAGVIVLKRQHDGPFVLMFGELDMP